MMRRIVLVLTGILLLVAPSIAEGEREQALRKIEALLDAGELDTAKKAIDHLLEHNPGDTDLLRLAGEWRLRKSGAAKLLEGGDPRENCWAVVDATMRGNPEEWPTLLSVRDRARVKALLERRRDGGSPEERRTAADLLARIDAAPKPPPERKPEELVAAIRKGPAECLAALREAERRRIREVRPFAKEICGKARDPELEFAAAGVLLALGDEKPRARLRDGLRAERPVTAVMAMEVLLRHPGSGESPIRTLFVEIEDDESILRVKPTLLALAIEALGGSGEKGARAFLQERLSSPAHCVDAARALGALGDPDSLPALLRFIQGPTPEEEDATSGGLGYLGKAAGFDEAAVAEELRPVLVGAIAVLRLREPTPK